MDEEVVMLEEQLATANADIERLQTQVVEAQSLATARGEELAALRQRAGEPETRLTEYGAELDEVRGAYETQSEAMRDAVGRLRAALLEREPDLPSDIVTGDTVADLDASIQRARETVAQVRQHLEQQAQALRVPAGAPVRGAPDVSSLSAAEKIRLGLRQT